MAYLNIAGISTIPVVKGEGVGEEPERGGADVRAFAGNLRSTVRWEKRQWTVTTVALSAAAAAALRAAIVARPVNVSGDITAGATVPCIVTETGGPFKTSTKQQLTLLIREV